MTLSLDTYQPVVRESFLTTEDPFYCYIYLLRDQNIESAVLNISNNIVLPSASEDDELTMLSMESSLESFAELWESEDDEYWSSYLND